MWPREERSPETQEWYIDKYEYAQFMATSGLPGPTMDELGKIRQFRWGQSKEVLENQTTQFTEHGKIYSVFNNSSSRIRIVPEDSKQQ